MAEYIRVRFLFRGRHGASQIVEGNPGKAAVQDLFLFLFLQKKGLIILVIN